MSRIPRACLAVLVVAVALAGCSAPVPVPEPTGAPSPVPKGDGVLRIGTLIPSSGSTAFLGASQTAAVAVAVAEINAAGGVNGTPVEVIAGDSGDASTATAEASLADLVKNGADAVIGPTSSVLAQRLIVPLVAAGIPMISPAATSPDLTDAADDGLFFRTAPAYGDQGTALGAALTAKGTTKIALVYTDDDLGKAIVPTLTAAVTAGGATLTTSAVEPTATDFSGTIAEVVAAAPDAVVLATSYATLDLTKALITQLVGAGYGGSKLWLTSQNSGDYSQALPAGSIQGVNGIIEGARPDDAFLAKLKAVNANLANASYALEAYDAVILAALAAEIVRDDAGSAIAASLTDASRDGIKCTSYAECLTVLDAGGNIDYDGLSGPLDFTAAGDPHPAFWGFYTFNADNKYDFASGILSH